MNLEIRYQSRQCGKTLWLKARLLNYIREYGLFRGKELLPEDRQPEDVREVMKQLREL